MQILCVVNITFKWGKNLNTLVKRSMCNKWKFVEIYFDLYTDCNMSSRPIRITTAEQAISFNGKMSETARYLFFKLNYQVFNVDHVY